MYDLNVPMAKAEGLPKLVGIKIEVIFGGSKRDSENGMAEMKWLGTQEKAVARIGAYKCGNQD